MEVNHVLGILVESLQIVWCYVLRQQVFVDGFDSIWVLNSFTRLALMRVLLTDELEGQGTRKVLKVVAKQIEHPSFEVQEVSLDPFATLVVYHSFICKA